MILWKWPVFTAEFHQTRQWKSLVYLLPILPYVFFLSGAIISIRYTQTGFTFSSLLLAFSYFLIVNETLAPIKVAVMNYLALLLPINFVWFSLLKKRKLLTPRGWFYFFPILIEIVLVGLILLISGYKKIQLFPLGAIIPAPLMKKVCDLSIRLDTLLFSHSFLENSVLSFPVIMMAGVCFLFLFIRFLKTRSPTFAGFIGILWTAFLGIALNGQYPATLVFFTASGIILIVSAIEVSFALAYIDDLTRLPGRRSLNEALINLGGAYVIAMVDVDHFKKFNDTYGHDTGDQVLKMIAAQFSMLSGGAKSFRYGGEEFTAIFKGKSLEEAMPHLEKFRKSIETTPFFVRGKERPQSRSKGFEKRKTSGARDKSVRVTVSIGVSEPSKTHNTPNKVIINADKALYRAKKAGRNRVMA